MRTVSNIQYLIYPKQSHKNVVLCPPSYTFIYYDGVGPSKSTRIPSGNPIRFVLSSVIGTSRPPTLRDKWKSRHKATSIEDDTTPIFIPHYRFVADFIMEAIVGILGAGGTQIAGASSAISIGGPCQTNKGLRTAAPTCRMSFSTNSSSQAKRTAKIKTILWRLVQSNHASTTWERQFCLYILDWRP